MMETRSSRYVAESCDGSVAFGDPALAIQQVCTDSRQVTPGNLFVAIKGDRFDGHDHAEEAIEAGAVGIMVQYGRVPERDPGCGVIAVGDTRKALGRLAARYRNEFTPRAIAIAGSNGKTTTKDLVASVLSERFNTLASRASFNNDIGVPLTLLRLKDHHQVLVAEVGTNHPGELAPLVDMVRPSIGILTSIGAEHLEYFADLEGVVSEEAALGAALPEDGLLIVGHDSDWSIRTGERSRARMIKVGPNEGDDWRITEVTIRSQGTRFELLAPAAAYSGRYEVSLLGRHQALNAALAVAAGAECGLSRMEILRGLERCRSAPGRMQLRRAGDWVVLDDSYNANQDSMKAALEVLRAFPCEGRRLAVLGEMAELGEAGRTAHYEVGRMAAASGIQCLVTIGRMGAWIGESARESGLQNVLITGQPDEAIERIRKLIGKGDVVLVKASRTARLEQVSEALATGD